MTIELFFQIFGVISFSYMMAKFAVSGPTDDDYDWDSAEE